MNKIKIISVINQKGGIGKSTTSQALAAGLNLNNYKVLLIDLDPQANTTYTRGIISTTGTTSTMYDVILNKSKIEDTIKTFENESDIIPAGDNLTNLDIELNGVGKEYKLKESIKDIKDNYDYIIIDTPPSLGILTVNALTASDDVIIPATADAYSLQGIGQLYNTITAVKEYCNPKLKIQGILLTRHNERTILNRDMGEMIEDTAKQLDTSIYDTFIREGVAVREAQVKQMDIFNYAKKSNPAIDYMNFVYEVIERSKVNE